MTNVLVGYIIGKYASEHGSYADFHEILMRTNGLEAFRTPEVERFWAIQKIVSQHDMTQMNASSALQLLLLPYFQQLPEEELPFYFLPLAYLRGVTFEDVVQLTLSLMKQLTDNEPVVEQVLCMVSVVKWALTTFNSSWSFLNRCFPTIQDYDFSSSNVVGQALSIGGGAIQVGGARSESPIECKLKKACEEPTHAAVRCALVYALAEVNINNVNYKPSDALGSEKTDQALPGVKPSILEDFSVPFPLKPRLSSHIDTHIVEGYYRLDGYIAWQMKPKNEPLLDVFIFGDDYGPDRDVLRFWNFCNKHLRWEELAGEADDFFSDPTSPRIDWRAKAVRREIQWNRRRVAFVLDNARRLSFVPDIKKKIFNLDRSEAKFAGIPLFHPVNVPGLSLFDDDDDE